MEENGKTRKFFERLANDPRTVKVLLVLICCLTVLLSALIVLAGLQGRRARQAEGERAAVMSAETQQPAQQRILLLNGYAEEDRLYLSLAAQDGSPLPEQPLPLRVRYPNGEVFSFLAEQGQLQLSRLPAGEYTIEVPATEVCAAAGPLYCTVYTDAYGGMSAQGTPVLDEQGEPRYRCHFLQGPKGYLLSTQSYGESRVLPVDADGDGVPEYGLELQQVAQTQDEAGGAFWRKIRLFREDGHPVSDFAVERTAVFAESEQPRGWQRVDGKMYYYSDYGYPLSGLQRVDGKLVYFDPQGVKAKALGIDASYYNERINWETAKAQGIDFAIVRIGGRGWTSGALYGDLRTYEYLMGAHKAGVKTGVYFYTTAINAHEAAEEARAALQSLNGLPLDLPIFIDMEFSGEYPRGRADGLNAAQRLEIIRTFCETVRFAGYSAGIYSGQYFYERNLYYPALSRYQVWLANYTGYGELPNFAERYDIWQFSDRGTVPGVPGRADLNVMF